VALGFLSGFGGENGRSIRAQRHIQMGDLETGVGDMDGKVEVTSANRLWSANVDISFGK